MDQTTDSYSQAVDSVVHAGTSVSVSLDVAATIASIAWPIVVVVLLLAYKDKLPIFFSSLLSRAEKFSIGNVSIELAKAKAFAPQWSPTGSPMDMMDVRHSMGAMEISDSTVAHFKEQLIDDSEAAYAIVDLGAGEEWLSSRLFILAIILRRTKGIRAFVFVRSIGEVKNKYLGWADPVKIRWALAKRYPWLEEAYACAYSSIFAQPGDINIVSLNGHFEKDTQTDPPVVIELLQKYLEETQNTQHMGDGWIQIKSQMPTETFEHATWLYADDIEDILEDALMGGEVSSDDFNGKAESEKIKRLISIPQRYVAITDEKHRFKELIDRQVILEKVIGNLSASGAAMP